MPLVSFEGVAVNVPTTVEGIEFAFINGTLTIKCQNFSGNIVMNKRQQSLVLGELPTSSQSIVVDDEESDVEMIESSSKKRPLEGATETSTSSEDSGSKRVRRPNFLSDVEQTMQLAQFELTQQSTENEVESNTGSEKESKVDTESVEGDETSLTLTQSTPEQISPGKATPVKTKKGIQPTLLEASFFSPDPKHRANKKKKEVGKGSQADVRQLLLTPVKNTSVKDSTAQWSSLTTQGIVPIGRWGHSVTAISDNRVVVYGGADDEEGTLGDLHLFDLKSQTWSRPLNCESIPRTWHDAVYLATKQLVLVFGGERNVSEDQTDVLSDIMVLDTDCFLWYPPAVSGVPPTARSGHTCAVLGNDVVVFGGTRGRSRQASVHVLDSDTFHWRSIKIEGKTPSARTYHSAVSVGEDMIVYFGGNDSKKSFSSVHVLRKSISGENTTWSWFHPCIVGTAPKARTGHSATLIDESKILIFGGWDPQVESTNIVFDDAFVLDTETWEWKSVVIEGIPSNELIGRVGHRAVCAEKNTIVYFGGQNGQEQRLNTIHSLKLS